MRPDSEFLFAKKLATAGLNNSQISKTLEVPLSTVQRWVRQGRKTTERDERCPICGLSNLDEAAYSYLLGLYLGDGCIVHCRRGVLRLSISLDLKYPQIIEECLGSIRAIHPRGRANIAIHQDSWAEAYSYWKHWTCLFPQHGPGMKHLRRIELVPWQRQIATAKVGLLLRGLIHSDGSRVRNQVGGKVYPRYQFTNNSEDLRAIFCEACDIYGVAWRQSNWRTISISRRPDVAKLDLVVGPKA